MADQDTDLLQNYQGHFQATASLRNSDFVVAQIKISGYFLTGNLAEDTLFYYKSQFKQFLISYYFTKMYFEESQSEIKRFGVQTNTTLPEMDGPFHVCMKCEQKSQAVFKNDEWSLQQNAKYIVFIEKYVKLLQGKAYSKLWPIYRAMSEFIQSRNIRQCKLYHQRNSKKYRQIGYMAQELKKQNHILVTLLNEEAAALNLHISNKIKTYISSKQHTAAEELFRSRSPFLEKFNKTSSEYPLQLTLLSCSGRKQAAWSEKDGDIMCQKLFQEWSNRLNTSVLLSSLL